METTKTECAIKDVKDFFGYDTAGSFMADWKALSTEDHVALKALLTAEIEAGRWARAAKTA